MKKIFIIGVIILFLGSFSLADRKVGDANFLGSAISVDATVTKVNGTDFDSLELSVANPETRDEIAIIITFTRTAGTASTLDFSFEYSYNGTTWDTVPSLEIKVATDSTARSNVVVKTTIANTPGIAKIRLAKIKNNDTSNNVTAVNATLSF